MGKVGSIFAKKREMQTNRKEFQFPSELSVTEKT